MVGSGCVEQFTDATVKIPQRRAASTPKLRDALVLANVCGKTPAGRGHTTLSILANRQNGDHGFCSFWFAADHETDDSVTGRLSTGSAPHGFNHSTGHAKAQDFFAEACCNRRACLIVRI